METVYVAATVKFIEAVLDTDNPLVKPVITPRFALSCDLDLMKKLGNLAREKDVHVQTHISENVNEVKTVATLFPKLPSYAGVYDAADVSGGDFLSNAMRADLQVSVHLSFTKVYYNPLTYKDLFYLATRGGAEALAMREKIGNFEVGKEFDALVIDLAIPNSVQINFFRVVKLTYLIPDS